jgi:hypothetical protein
MEWWEKAESGKQKAEKKWSGGNESSATGKPLKKGWVSLGVDHTPINGGVNEIAVVRIDPESGAPTPINGGVNETSLDVME